MEQGIKGPIRESVRPKREAVCKKCGKPFDQTSMMEMCPSGQGGHVYEMVSS